MSKKQGMRKSGLEGLLNRIWEIVGLWPKISDPELQRRAERFIMAATPDELFHMQQVLFQEATPYLVEDDKVRDAMRDLNGKCIGLAIRGEYETTVTLRNLRFTIERGIEGEIPVISVDNRRDYADAILSIRDPLSMFLKGRIKITRKLTILRWGLPQLGLLLDNPRFDKFLGYQDDVEEVLDENLRQLGY